MSRFAKTRRVYFFEEPVFEDDAPIRLRIETCSATGVNICTPVLHHGMDSPSVIEAQRSMLDELLCQSEISRYLLWYYTPMAREFSRHLKPNAIVYDCMDELSAFAGAPPAMQLNEQELFRRADLVFTGGASLYESKKKQHEAVYPFPSSVDIDHFSQARTIDREPDDQAKIAFPRIGYAGVLDERLNLNLIGQVAQVRPDWNLVFLGPVCKIDPVVLPKASNVYYLGMKSYSDLPKYLSGWQVGMLPFAMNDSTRFISPTKTPEYLAAGLRAVSTPIRDVVTPYGDLGLVEIAGTADEFVSSVGKLLNSSGERDFRARADAFLSKTSWNQTWSAMNQLIEAVIRKNSNFPVPESAPTLVAAAQGVSHV